jgi:hypothetical protein
MARQSIYSQQFEDAFTPVQTELLEVLIQDRDSNCYPWNPTEVEVEAYLAELDSEFELDGWSDEEIQARSERFFSQLDSCFPSLAESLAERFAARVPTAWVEAIAQKAQALVTANLSLADQLVQCVQELFPNWQEDDLLVVARPVAYAMREETEATDRPLTVAPSTEWQDLSEIEQARLSIAIARYAIAQVQD